MTRSQTSLCLATPRRGWLLAAFVLLASSQCSLTLLAVEPVAGFKATVKLTHYRDNGTPAFAENRTLEGLVFGDGFHVWSRTESQEETYTQASAVVSNTVYSLKTRGAQGSASAYQALLERGIVSRFLTRDHQVVALALAIASHWEGVAHGNTKILLSLGEPFPEYYNSYSVDRTEWPNKISVVARAPDFVLCNTGLVVLPKPYDSGFKYWTLDVDYAAGRPVAARFRKFTPLDSAITDAQMGRTARKLESLAMSADVVFTWGDASRAFDRLPAPPKLPFDIEDHRFVYDTYTNNRVSAMVEGAAVLSCTNIDWSYPIDRAIRVSTFVQRGIASRDAALRRPWLRPAFFAICVAALTLPALLVWRKGSKRTSRNAQDMKGTIKGR